MAIVAPDVSEQTVCIDYFDDDEGYCWHGRLLLSRLSGPRWIVATPDLDVQVADLSLHRVLPVGRGGRYPQRTHDEGLYTFDVVGAADLARVRAGALDLARALGEAIVGVPVDVGGSAWLYGDTAHPRFGELVAPDILAAAGSFEVRDSVALVLVDARWTTAECVDPADVAAWRLSKTVGPGRDVRLTGWDTDSAGRRYATLPTCVGKFKRVVFPDWPFGDSPSAAVELAEGIRASGVETPQFHTLWVSKSGVAANSAVSLEHRNDLTTFHILVTYDQLDASNVAGIEFVARKILRTQRAVKRSPKSPDFGGLDGMLAHAFDESGGVVCSKFDKFFSDQQRDQAFILKQQRLWKEEADKTDKRGAK
jgi:hypothetical protein